jgi:hypothetical protein
MRRRKRKRLLADASTFPFDLRDVDDSGLVDRFNTGNGNSDNPLNNRVAIGFAGVGTGIISKRRPVRSPPVPIYAPRDNVGYDGGYPAQYHSQDNTQVVYSSTQNTHNINDPGNNDSYPNNQGQHSPYYLPSSIGDDTPMTNICQLQPGVCPAQGPTFCPSPFENSPPLPIHTPPTPSTTSLPPYSLQPLAPDYRDLPRLPTSGALPNSFGQRNSIGGVEDTPGQRTLHVRRSRSTVIW